MNEVHRTIKNLPALGLHDFRMYVSVESEAVRTKLAGASDLRVKAVHRIGDKETAIDHNGSAKAILDRLGVLSQEAD